ncbi:MAG: protein tyrosine phosphatase [Saprospiraceae bacterium]|nr:protein tyrosine phosphatase [Saprospiraceae bacterium]
MKRNFLFICSKNEWRSRTAETIFRNDSRFHVKSAGTSRTARIRVSERLLLWADVIFVMEDHHKKRLYEHFAKAMADKEVIVLDIPDEYPYMNEELIAELEDTINDYDDDLE